MAVMHIQRNPKRQRSNIWNDHPQLCDRYMEYINNDYENAPWRRMTHYENGLAGLHHEIADFYQYIRPKTPECNMRQEVVTRIQRCITNIWPKAKVEVFGSSRTQLFLPTSDIDIVVIGEWDIPPLRTLEQALRGYNFVQDLRVLDNATVPIVKLTDNLSKVNVDISFNTENGISAAELVNGYIREYPALPPLVMLLKQFLSQRALNEVFSGGLSSYALTLMIVSFLQLRQKKDGRSETTNFGALLMEFFELYGHKFKYSTTAIRVGTSETSASYVPKEEVLKSSGRVSRPQSSILCIEDPLKPGNDVARNSYAVLQVKHAFDYAFLVLHSTMLSQERSRPSFGSRRGYREESVLAKLVCIPHVVNEYRKWICMYFNHASKFQPSLQTQIYYQPLQSLVMSWYNPPDVIQTIQSGTFSPESGIYSACSGGVSSVGDDDRDDAYSSDDSDDKVDAVRKDSENEYEKTDADDESTVSSPEVPENKHYSSPASRRRHSTSHQLLTVVSPVISSPNSKGVPQSISEPLISSSPVGPAEVRDKTYAPASNDNNPSSESANVDPPSDRETVLPTIHSANSKRSYASVVGKNSHLDRNDNECRQSVCSNEEICDTPSISSGVSHDNGYSSYLSSDVGDDVKESSSLSPCDREESSNKPRVIKYNPSECRRATSSTRRSVSLQRRRSPSLPPHSTSSRDSPTGPWQQTRRQRRKRTTNHNAPHVSSTNKNANSVR